MVDAAFAAFIGIGALVVVALTALNWLRVAKAERDAFAEWLTEHEKPEVATRRRFL